MQDAFVEDAPELGRTRSAQNCLAGQTGGYLLVEVLQVAVGAGGQDRAGIVPGLQQAGGAAARVRCPGGDRRGGELGTGRGCPRAGATPHCIDFILTAGEVTAESTALVFAEKEPLGYVSDHIGLRARLSLSPSR